MSFRTVHHTADLAVRLRGRDNAGLLRCATDAICRLIAGTTRPAVHETAELSATGRTVEQLIVNWANELIFLYDARGHLAVNVREVTIRSGEDGLTASGTVGLCHTRELAFEPENDLKAATFHGLAVVRDDSGNSLATLVIDT